MPPLPVLEDVFRVALSWLGPNGVNAANVIHIESPTGSTQDVLNALNTHVTAGMWGGVAGVARVNNISAIRLDGTSGTVELVLAPAAKWTGSGAGEAALPDSILVHLATGSRGRHRRGRIYLPFPAEAVMSQGALLSTTVTSMQAAWDTFRTAMSGAGFALVVASYTTLSWQPVIACTVEGALATQRRRQSRYRKAQGY